MRRARTSLITPVTTQSYWQHLIRPTSMIITLYEYIVMNVQLRRIPDSTYRFYVYCNEYIVMNVEVMFSLVESRFIWKFINFFRIKVLFMLFTSSVYVA